VELFRGEAERKNRQECLCHGAGGGVTTGPRLPVRWMREAEIGTLHVAAEQNAGEALELAGVVPF
jgi:hypothetical protein